MATDDTKPAEHPAPWRWNAEPEQHSGWLLDADNAVVVSSQVDTKFDDDLPTSVVVVSSYARELIRLAPEMSDLLQRALVRFGRVMEMWTYDGERPGDMDDRDKARVELLAIRNQLAALDAARKGTA